MSTEQEEKSQTLGRVEQALNISCRNDLKWINDQMWPDDKRRAASNLASRLNEGLSDAGVEDYRVFVVTGPARIGLDQR